MLAPAMEKSSNGIISMATVDIFLNQWLVVFFGILEISNLQWRRHLCRKASTSNDPMQALSITGLSAPTNRRVQLLFCSSFLSMRTGPDRVNREKGRTAEESVSKPKPVGSMQS